MPLLEYELDGFGVESVEVTAAEMEGLRLYWERHPHIPLMSLTRIYLSAIRRGADLNKMPVPPRDPDSIPGGNTNGKH